MKVFDITRNQRARIKNILCAALSQNKTGVSIVHPTHPTIPSLPTVHFLEAISSTWDLLYSKSRVTIPLLPLILVSA